MCHAFDKFLNVTAHNWFPEVAFEKFVRLFAMSVFPSHVSKTSNMYMRTEGCIYRAGIDLASFKFKAV